MIENSQCHHLLWDVMDEEAMETAAPLLPCPNAKYIPAPQGSTQAMRRRSINHPHQSWCLLLCSQQTTVVITMLF